MRRDVTACLDFAIEMMFNVFIYDDDDDDDGANK